jgi:DNA-binding winged helix-turn-helix (wHTH) protein
MDVLDYGPVVVQLGARRVERPDGVEKLTAKEAEALAWLVRHPGRPVGREELEREVWRLRPGVKSETVPVTMRRLRKKLELDPKNPAILHIARGRGWWLEPPPQRIAPLPRPATPWFDRPVHREAIAGLLAVWPHVTVVGPGGIGKTRMALAVAGGWHGEVFWVPIGATRSAADLRQTLAMALDAGEQADLAEVLARRRDPLVVFDEAETSLEAVQAVAAELPRVLATSRRALGLPGEAVYELPPLSPDEGLRFLSARQVASRWHRATPPEVAQRLIDALDGVPLGIELALAQPRALPSLVEALESASKGALPQLDATLQRSWESLGADAREALCVFSLFSDTFGTTQAMSCVAGVDLTDLADRSWLTWEDGRWRILRTTRVFLRRQEADWAALTRRYRRWLADALLGVHEAITTDTARARREYGPLIPDALDWLEEAPDDAAGIVPALTFWFTYQGHRARSREILVRALRAARTDPTVHALAAIESIGDVDAAIAAAEASDEVDAHRMAMVARLRRGEQVTEAGIEQLAGVLGTPLAPTSLLLWVVYLTSTGSLDVRDPRVERLKMSAPEGGYYRSTLIGFDVRARYLERGVDAARALAEECIAGARAGSLWNGRATLIALLTTEDPPEALTLALEHQEIAQRVGDREHEAVSMSLLAAARFRLGDAEGARRTLEAVDDAVAQRIRDTAERVQIVRALLGDASAPAPYADLVDLHRRLLAGEDVTDEILALKRDARLTRRWLVTHLHEMAREVQDREVR